MAFVSAKNLHFWHLFFTKKELPRSSGLAQNDLGPINSTQYLGPSS
jgi:hypothetical protein